MNNVVVRKLPLGRALDESVAEGLEFARNQLNHFLKGRGRSAYLSALKTAATTARWSEVKGTMAARRGLSVNDGTMSKVHEGLKAFATLACLCPRSTWLRGRILDESYNLVGF